MASGALAIASPLCGHPAGGLFTLTPVIMGTSGPKPTFLIGPLGVLSSVYSRALTFPHRACFLECPLETTPACHLPVPSIATSCSLRRAKKAPEVPPSSFPTALGGVREPLQYGDCTVLSPVGVSVGPQLRRGEAELMIWVSKKK